ncbi:MAG TPA: tetratricopeptide repeat protein, partial [Ktedonobacteraceae bacterium]
SKEEWIEQRKDWLYQSSPDAFEPSFVFERKPQKTKLWLPSMVSSKQEARQKEIEAGWSVEIRGTSLNYMLPEVPEATAVYEETNRRWLWASYTLVRENGLWRIQNMIDAGKEAQNLSIKELRGKIGELHAALRKIMKEHDIEKLSEDEAVDYVDQLLIDGIRSVYYSDILIKKDPFDAKVYEDAATLAANFGEYERALVYLIPQAQLFPEQRGETLRRMSMMYRRQSTKYDECDDDERSERCNELAEEALNGSIAIESSFLAHISLAEMLIEKDERLDEAEDHLRQALALAADAADEAHIELHLAEIAEVREQFQEALSHYQRVVDLKPNSAEAWADLGSAYKTLEQFEDAERSYRHAIELEPDNSSYYDALCSLYLDENQSEKALEILNTGLKANPDSAGLYASLAAFYMGRDDYRQAELFLEKAEQLDPDSERVITFRAALRMIMTELASTRKSIPAGNRMSSRSAKQKKRRR